MSATLPRHTDESADNAFGVSIFAGVLLTMLGGFQILQGISGVLKDDILLSTPSYAYEIDLTAWGWTNLIVGAVAVAVGIGVLKGQAWAFSAGIAFAGLNALGQFAYLPHYPIWSIILIAMDIVIIWALAKLLGES